MPHFSKLISLDHSLPLPTPLAVVGRRHCQADGDITHFHYHQNQVEIAYCHRGQGIFIVDTAVVAFGPGDVVIVPAGTPHAIQSMSGSSSDWYFNHFCPAAVLSSIGPLPKSVLAATEQWWHFPRSTHQTISDTTLLLTGEVVNVLPSTPYHTSSAAQGFILALLSLVASANAKHSQGKPTPCRLKRISPAISYLSQHFTHPLKVEALAQCCAVSAVHFRRLFHELVGMSPRRYLFALRVEMAKAMLSQTARPVQAVAEAVGFQSLSSFNHQFRKQTTLSPRAYRQQRLNVATLPDDT